MRTLSTALVGLGLVGWLIAGGQESKTRPADLVTAREGELPIILSAPHGGALPIPGVPERKGDGLKKGPSGFFTGRDTGTEELAHDIAAAVGAKLGKKPYLVLARFHRKYSDANRPPDIAYEHPKARPVYDAYHDALARYTKDVQKKYGRGLLLDVHGQGTAKDTIFRGTRNGQTVQALVRRFGKEAHDGPNSFFGLLAEAGCKVHPADGGKEQAGFTGGFIVGNYGSHQGEGVDAVQLEFGGDYRSKDGRKAAAEKVARAVEGFAKRYLPTEAK